MEKFVHRPVSVQAIQYTKDCNVEEFRDMLYRQHGLVTKRVGIENGERVPRYSIPQLKLKAGLTILKQGDWIIRHQDGHIDLMSDDKFRATYQRPVTV